MAWLLVATAPIPQQPPDHILGDAVIRGRTEDSKIVIVTTDRCAGAIHSLRWRGKEFLDSFDHGLQLQSASNLDAGLPITAETFNPTEAGSRHDGTGNRSSSQLIRLDATRNRLKTLSRMAFWLAPGEASGENLAKNTTVVSQHLLRKRVTIGVRHRSQLIGYDVTFTLPKGETHEQAVFKSLTGYMPAEFSRFWHYDFAKKALMPLSDGPGEQNDPVVLATENGEYARGIYSPEKMPKGYGRWRFTQERVVKWNCVFRVANPGPGTSYTFRHFVAVGTLAQVQEELGRLAGQRQ